MEEAEEAISTFVLFLELLYPLGARSAPSPPMPQANTTSFRFLLPGNHHRWAIGNMVAAAPASTKRSRSRWRQGQAEKSRKGVRCMVAVPSFRADAWPLILPPNLPPGHRGCDHACAAAIVTVGVRRWGERMRK